MKQGRFAGLFVAGVTMAALSMQAHAIVISGSSGAYGESVKLTALGGVLSASSGPLPAVSGVAPPPYNLTPLPLAGVTVTSGPITVLSAGVLTVSASSNVDGLPGSRSAQANADVKDASGEIPLVITFGGAGSAITSNAMVSGDYGALVASGGSTLDQFTLNIGGTNIVVVAASAPNTHAFTGLGLDVILNEQILTGDGIGSLGLEVNAFHVSFTNFDLGPGLGLLTGDIIISHSEAALAAAPVPPSIWLLGAGLIVMGVARRQRLPAAG